MVTASPSDPDRRLATLEWTVLRRLDGLLQGDYRTLFQGMGLDFADLKAYQFGDDVRTIDWNVTARLTEPYVRRYHEDRDLQAWFLVDTSPSLDFGSQGRLKREGTVDLVGALASVLVRGGNRVGACLSDGSLPKLIPASGGRRAVLGLLRALAEPPSTSPPGETDLAAMLDAMAGVLRRRCLVFVISDFYSRPGWESVLGRLNQRHEVLAIRVEDPLDSELPEVGVVWLEDSETGRQLLVDTMDAGFRRRLAAAQTERSLALKAQFRAARVDPLTFSTTDDLVRTLWTWALRRRVQKTHNGGLL